jgi:hypothetical protein
MNIFVLDRNPKTAAQLQCDKHVVKMIVESAQMLSTAHRMLDGYVEKRPSKSGKRIINYWVHPNQEFEDVLYKAVHHKHPCTIWTMESVYNYHWHYDHFVALLKEYTYRYGKSHSTERLKYWLIKPPTRIPHVPFTKFKLAMTHEPQCIDESNTVKSYQEYYKTKKDRFNMVWTKRDVPEWFNVA